MPHYDDAMSTGNAVRARQASVSGPLWRFVARACAILCWAFIAFLPAMLYFDQVSLPWWGATLGCLGLGLFMLASGLLLWSEATAARADTDRLQRQGRSAVAEVVGLEIIDPGDGSADVAQMELDIAGDGVPAFHAVYRVDHDENLYRVGACFKAVVDPSDNLFTLRRL